MKSNGCVPLLNILHKIHNKATIYVNKLLLTAFSPFHIKCEKLNVKKTSGNVFLGHLGGQIFHIFLVALDHLCVYLCVYCPMSWENVLGYMFSSLFTQLKVAKGYIFTMALQKDKPNPDFLGHGSDKR